MHIGYGVNGGLDSSAHTLYQAMCVILITTLYTFATCWIFTVFVDGSTACGS